MSEEADAMNEPAAWHESEYRLARLERDIAQISSNIMSIQSSVAALQIGLPEKFTPRSETDRAHMDLGRRLEENSKRLDMAEARFWQLLGGVLLALLTALLAFLHPIPALH